MSRKKLLQEMIAVTLIMLPSVGCSARATTHIPEVLAPTSTPGPIANMMRYSDPYLGFVVEYPPGWEVKDCWEFQSLTWVGFRSSLYMGEEQAFGTYSIDVAMGEAMRSTITDTVEYLLSPIIPEVRDRIKPHCCLTVDREQAMELTGFPCGRWGCRLILIVHDGRVYWLTFYPYNVQFNTPSDNEAREAFEAFLRSFKFIPVTPIPTITPVPTPAF